MSRVAIITDLHFGVSGDNPTLAAAQTRFFRNVLFPYINREHISDVIIAGDVFDRRRDSLHSTVKMACDELFQPLADDGISVNAIVGNHDVYYKNTNSTNTLRLFTSGFSNVNVVDFGPASLFNDKVLLVPWITQDNADVCMAAIRKHVQPICIGHFQMEGFQLLAGQPLSKGMDRSLFRPFDLCLSGHFHKRMVDGNITYLGTAYQMTWSDAGQTKGFHVLDTETGDLDFVPNPEDTFLTVVYHDNMVDPDLDGKIVRVVVPQGESVNAVKLDAFVRGASASAAKLSVMDNITVANTVQSDVEVHSTLDELIEAIPDFAPNADKTMLADIQRDIVKLYADAHGI